jgi:AcrR family transcriptional regulator
MTAGDPTLEGSTVDSVAGDDHLPQSINAVLRAVRRENGEQPLGSKAIRTRQLLLEAAVEEFREKGYQGTSTLAIAERAGVSLATFYQYFADLSGIVAVLTGEHAIAMLEAHVDDWDPRTGREGVRRMVSAFVRSYLDSAAFYRLYEEATALDPRIASIRRDFWAAYKRRIEKSLRVGVEAGVVRDDLPLAEVARTLTHLMYWYCHDIALRDPARSGRGGPSGSGPEADQAIETLTTLWSESIRLAEPALAPSGRRTARRPAMAN